MNIEQLIASLPPHQRQEFLALRNSITQQDWAQHKQSGFNPKVQKFLQYWQNILRQSNVPMDAMMAERFGSQSGEGFSSPTMPQFKSRSVLPRSKPQMGMPLPKSKPEGLGGSVGGFQIPGILPTSKPERPRTVPYANMLPKSKPDREPVGDMTGGSMIPRSKPQGTPDSPMGGPRRFSMRNRNYNSPMGGPRRLGGNRPVGEMTGGSMIPRSKPQGAGPGDMGGPRRAFIPGDRQDARRAKFQQLLNSLSQEEQEEVIGEVLRRMRQRDKDNLDFGIDRYKHAAGQPY